jgi:hypothetical protein
MGNLVQDGRRDLIAQFYLILASLKEWSLEDRDARGKFS